MSAPSANPLVSRLSMPPIPLVASWGKAYDGARGPLIDLSQAVPGYPAHPAMLELLGEAARSPACAGYGPIEGEPALRAAYADHVAALYDARIDASNIQITAGCNQAFMCTAIALAAAGEPVALTNPFYFNHDTTLAMLGIPRLSIECDPSNGFLPDIGSAEAALAAGAKVIAVVTPNNPTGAVYPPDLLYELFSLCRRHGAWLVIDETYRDFLPLDDGAPHHLLQQEDWHRNLILLYSFSKSFCIPGHRLGAITAGPDVIADIAKIMDNMQICAPRAAQQAVAAALPLLKDWRDGNRLEIAHRADALRKLFAGSDRWQIAAVGAYFAFMRHPFPKEGSVAVAERLARTAGVVTIPGRYFGSGLDEYLRFAFANVDAAAIAQLKTRLG